MLRLSFIIRHAASLRRIALRSVLGPYFAELFDVIARSGLAGHSYADDT